MPEIVERAGETLGKRVGPLPLGGWAAIGIGTIVVVKLLRGGKSGGGGSSGTVTLPDAFAGDPSGSGASGAGTTLPTTTPPAGSGSPAPAPAHYRLTVTGHTPLYSTIGKLTQLFVVSGTYDATRINIGGHVYYRIKHLGAWRLIPAPSKTIHVTQVRYNPTPRIINV